MKVGERWTNWGVAFVCKVAHLSSAANEPISDATAIYARVFTGAYVATTTYKKYDGVSYNGAGFFSRIEDNLGHTPPADGTSDAYWYCYAQRGIIGLQGPSGGVANHLAYEEPAGTKDGVNKDFTLAHTPTGPVLLFYGSAGSLALMLYGDAFSNVLTALTTITFAPNTAEGDQFIAIYPYA
jgi:hypothetical protein